MVMAKLLLLVSVEKVVQVERAQAQGATLRVAARPRVTVAGVAGAVGSTRFGRWTARVAVRSKMRSVEVEVAVEVGYSDVTPSAFCLPSVGSRYFPQKTSSSKRRTRKLRSGAGGRRPRGSVKA